MDLATLCDRLDERLRTDDYADLDASPNGLQIGPESGSVDRVVCAVDAVRATAEAAVERDADLLVTHHGTIWGGTERVTDQLYDRLEPLYGGDCALYVSHLPLDGHPDLGNAAGLADLLGLVNREPFGHVGPEPIGLRGQAPDGLDPAAVRDLLADELDTGHAEPQLLDHGRGPDGATDVAVVTGSGADFFEEARTADVDLFVTGEGKGKLYHEAREAGVNVVLGGHYATETFGVRALADLVDDWGPDTEFVGHPTGL
jgi:dinuclear metal center YbgI/SA1388 family protein